jgi:hypothetical protein
VNGNLGTLPAVNRRRLGQILFEVASGSSVPMTAEENAQINREFSESIGSAVDKVRARQRRDYAEIMRANIVFD